MEEIQKGNLDRLFERFYRADAARSDQEGHYGLGLAIAKRSLEYMGGSIRALSVAEGAVFEITLPYDCRRFAPEELEEM